MSPVNIAAPSSPGPDALAQHWTLLAHERPWLTNKTGATRLGFAVLLKFFQVQGRFPSASDEIPLPIIAYLAQQVGVTADQWPLYDWKGRSIKSHRLQIRSLLGFREFTNSDAKPLMAWLQSHILTKTFAMDHLVKAAYEQCQALHIEPPTEERMTRWIRSASHEHEKRFCQLLHKQLSDATQKNLDALIQPMTLSQEMVIERTVLQDLRAGPGHVSLQNLFDEIVKLDRLRSLYLPTDFLKQVPIKILQHYKQRVSVEEPHELRRHPAPLRMTMLASFSYLRTHELTDTLLDLLIGTIHRIGARAERRVERELIQDLKRVTGKHRLLFEMADASLTHPDGIIKEVVYPVVGEQTLQELVKEWKSSGPAYRNKVQTVIRNTYRSHYRRMLPRLLEALEFRSNNDRYQPVIEALGLLKKYANTKIQFYPYTESVPMDGVVKALWQETVIDKDDNGKTRINRIAYEIGVLQTLREKLRCREIWVPGAKRHGNPDEDLPTDFDGLRTSYYEALKLPQDSAPFIEKIKTELKDALTALDTSTPTNPYVKFLPKADGWISVTPLDPQPEPTHLLSLKSELAGLWPMTSLLDILKEADLRVGFTKMFRSATSYERLDPADLQRRLLLCLYGLGTNTGFKRMCNDTHGVSYKELLYTRRRFVTADHLRNAITQIVNATFQIRLPQIWGEGTTACASDSKQFSSWDQNLMTEWHVRYGGRGVMIYWHVERKALCVHSQLKTCSSSEVAAMIEGLLRHDTDMELEKNYVDSHGQSEVAFAFCHLLGFQLLPRLKGIHAQRLYRPEAGNPNAFPSLQPVLTRPIDWDLIRQQYDQMVKYATALRLGTADTESILRRFTRNNLQHPTYKALAELGKAIKTIFLCKYLGSIELRREIQEGLNVIENWNSANSFIFFGKGGEFATNRHDDQEIIMLALHLLQVCLVYINTLMIQRVLAQPHWQNQLTSDDLRALTPLIYNHVNPYGTFKLDMRTRLVLDPE